MYIFTNKTCGHLKMIYIFITIILGEMVQMIAKNRSANAGVEILYILLINIRVTFWYLSVNNNILQVRDQVQLHKTQFLADVFIFYWCPYKHSW